jgi:hypothetical protein
VSKKAHTGGGADVSPTSTGDTTGSTCDNCKESLRVLVMGTDDWATEQMATSLVRAGHEVLRCHEPGEPAFPCNALIEGRQCPLDIGFDVALTTRARSVPAPTPGEIGVVCAIRAGAPLVVAGVPGAAPFQSWTAKAVSPAGDVVPACEEAHHESHAVVIDIRQVRT